MINIKLNKNEHMRKSFEYCYHQPSLSCWCSYMYINLYVCRRYYAIIRSLLDLSQFPCGQDWVASTQQERSRCIINNRRRTRIVQGENKRKLLWGKDKSRFLLLKLLDYTQTTLQARTPLRFKLRHVTFSIQPIR